MLSLCAQRSLFPWLSFSLHPTRAPSPFLWRFDQRSCISAGVFKESEGSPVLVSHSYPAAAHVSVLSFPHLPIFTLIFLFKFSFLGFIVVSWKILHSVGFYTLTTEHTYTHSHTRGYVSGTLNVGAGSVQYYCSVTQLEIVSELLVLIWQDVSAPCLCLTTSIL